MQKYNPPQRIRRAGYMVKQSFSNDFVRLLEDLYEEYGEQIFEIQGIANKYTDIAEFSRNFFNKSNNVASVSIDANANVKEKNVAQYTIETNKALMKINSFYTMFKYMRNMFSYNDACDAIRGIINGNLFLNDAVSYGFTSYCYAFDLRQLLMNGMNFVGSLNIRPPKRSESFIALIIQSTAFISNQIAGASSFPDFFIVLDYFYRKELGEDYIKELSEEQIKKIYNQFQNLIYSLNFCFRSGGQSAFTNLSVMDRGFLEELFSDYYFPDEDCSKPNLDSTLNLSKMFFEYFSNISGKEGIFTFPVVTLAISVDEENNYIDPDFVDWCAKANCEKSLGNIFIERPTSFSSCCRLKNDYSKLSDTGIQNSFGVGGLSIGSHRVCGINLPRLAIDELKEAKKKNPQDILSTRLEICHKILLAHRAILRDRIESGFLPLYTYKWIDLNRQYSTIGLIGVYEYIKNKKMEITSGKGIKETKALLKKIESTCEGWQLAEREAGQNNIYNIEQIPAETMAVRLAEIDTILGYNKEGIELYSNQYIPLVNDSSVYDRFRVQGEFDSHTSGGSILHLNVNDSDRLSEIQFRKLIEQARISKTAYFAVNYCFSVCDKNHTLVGNHDVCSICGSEDITKYTRVVGFITPITSWSSVRKNYEFENRVFYTNKETEE